MHAHFTRFSDAYTYGTSSESVGNYDFLGFVSTSI